MVKSKVPPRSVSSLEAVEPHPKKGAIKFFFFFFISMLSNAFFSVNFEQISHIALVVSIVDFEQVNACCT